MAEKDEEDGQIERERTKVREELGRQSARERARLSTLLPYFGYAQVTYSYPALNDPSGPSLVALPLFLIPDPLFLMVPDP